MILDRIRAKIRRFGSTVVTDNLAAFFVLAFGISWAFWLPMAWMGLSSPMLRILGSFGPGAAALILLAITEGRAGLRAIGRRMIIWRVGIGWYLVSLFGTAAILLPAIGIHLLLGGSGLQWNDPNQWYLIIPAFLQVLFLSVLGEEIGWRGFALPRLQRPLSALGASVLLGTIWGLWHLPLFWTESNFHSEIPFSLFLVQDIALAILFTWIFNNTRGSLLMAHLFHAASNTTIGVLPVIPSDAGGSLRPLVLAVGLLVAATVAVVVVYGPEQLSRRGDKIATPDAKSS